MTGAATGLRLGDVAVGDVLPELVIDVTATLVVAGALASRDFQEVHHDARAARERGSEDVFMNILTTNGLVCRFVTDWTGPDATILATSIRLGVPNYAGDRMTLTGTVAEVQPDGDGGIVTVAVRGRNGRGDHVTGTVRVALPGGPA